MDYYREEIQTDKNMPAKISFGGGSGDKLRYPLHWHQHLEFDLVLSGSICGTVSGVFKEVQPGEIFFVNSGELHETDATKGGILRAITILLSDELLREYDPEFLNRYFVIEKGSIQEKEIVHLIKECARSYREKEAYYELEISVFLRKICYILLTKCSRKRELEDRHPSTYKSTERIKKVITYMEEHFEDSISTKEMGELMGMTPAYFSRFFRQSTGQTFHECLTRIRLLHARTILLKEDASVTDISFDCGFPNVKAFIDAFKKEYKLTPAKYRMQYLSSFSVKEEKDKK